MHFLQTQIQTPNSKNKLILLLVSRRVLLNENVSRPVNSLHTDLPCPLVLVAWDLVPSLAWCPCPFVHLVKAFEGHGSGEIAAEGSRFANQSMANQSDVCGRRDLQATVWI